VNTPDLSPPIVHVLAETPDRFTLMKHDHRNDVRVVLSRAELADLVAKATEALERTQHEHEGNLRERERARLLDERQASLFETT
jgi:hypothetical protein